MTGCRTPFSWVFGRALAPLGGHRVVVGFDVARRPLLRVSAYPTVTARHAVVTSLSALTRSSPRVVMSPSLGRGSLRASVRGAIEIGARISGTAPAFVEIR